MAVAVLLLAGCGTTAQRSARVDGAPDESATLRVGYPLPPTLNPLTAPEPGSVIIGTWPVYDRLIQTSTESKYVPMLATAWKFSNGGRTLTLTLRQGVTFSDGTPFDAAAVKANLEHKTSKEAARTAQLASMKDVRVVDQHTVAIELNKPTTDILAAMSNAMSGSMISPKALNNPDLDTHPVGTGAYVIKDFVPGQSVTYERRTDKDGIWDDKTGKPQQVVISSLTDVSTRANALLGQRVDVAIWGADESPLKSALESKRLIQYPMPGNMNTVALNFNTRVKPFDDVRVRQAVNYAIDRAAITKAFFPRATPYVQPWPADLPGYDAKREKRYPFDPAKAKQLLTDAGHSGGVDAGEMLVPNTSGMVPAATAIQGQLADVGIKVKVRQLDTFGVLGEWPKGKAGMNLFYLSLPSIEPGLWVQREFLNPFWRPDGADPKIADLAQGLDNPSARATTRERIVGEIVDRAMNEAFYAPVWYGGATLIASPNVGGLDALAFANAVADLRNTYITK